MARGINVLFDASRQIFAAAQENDCRNQKDNETN